jgi:hypothetical protein
MLFLFKHNLKKKNFFNSLVLYFHFLTYKILLFFKIDILNYKIYSDFFKLIKKSNNIKFMKINTSNILSIFKNKNSKFLFTIFKRDLFIVSMNNLILINNSLLLNYLLMFSIDYYFINVKYLCKINILYKLLVNNYNLYKIFFLHIFYINYTYLYKIFLYKLLEK